MLRAFSSSITENHIQVANCFVELARKNIPVYPFNLYLESIKEKDVDRQLTEYFEKQDLGDSLNSDYFPINIVVSKKCVLKGLRGTALKYYRWKVEEDVKKRNDFKKLNVDNFRTKEARNLRDNAFEKQKISFMHQAFRFRGKANYRDSIFFFHNKEDCRLDELCDNLKFIARKFLLMASVYVKKRAGSSKWE